MNGDILEMDYQGRGFTVVRDIHGTRVGVRNIPRGHQVVLMVMVTADPDSSCLAIYQAGEGVELDDEVAAAVLAEISQNIGERFGYTMSIDFADATGQFENARDCGE